MKIETCLDMWRDISCGGGCRYAPQSLRFRTEICWYQRNEKLLATDQNSLPDLLSGTSNHAGMRAAFLSR